MANTRRKGKQRRRQTRRGGTKRQRGGENTGLDDLLFGDKTQGHRPLALSKAREGAMGAAMPGAISPLRRQVKQRYADYSASELGKVIDETKAQVAPSLANVKTVPGLMHEVSKRLDALVSELSQKEECLSGEVRELLTQLVFIISPDAVLNSLEEERKEKAAAEKATAEKAAADKAAVEKTAATEASIRPTETV